MSNTVEPLTLDAEVMGALTSLTSALRELLAHLADEIRRPTDLQHALSLDYKLAWQIFNIVRANNPLPVAHHVPGVLSKKRLLAAAAEKGVPAKILTAVDSAFQVFNEVVQKHAEDRPAFDAMLASITGSEANESLALQQRRNAYRAESQVWGTQMDVSLLQGIFRLSPADEGGARVDSGPRMADECILNTKCGLRRLRSNVPLIVRGHRQFASESSIVQRTRMQPLEPESNNTYGAPILKDFCSQPVPEFRTTQSSNGWVRTTLESEQIGRRSAVSFTFATVTHHTPIATDSEGRGIFHNGMAFKTPTEVAILELLVHRPSFGIVAPQIIVHATSPEDDAVDIIRSPNQFQFNEKVIPLGPASGLSPSMDVPRYPELMQHTFTCLGWNAAEFDVYRVRLQYPVLHAMAHFWFTT